MITDQYTPLRLIRFLGSFLIHMYIGTLPRDVCFSLHNGHNPSCLSYLLFASSLCQSRPALNDSPKINLGPNLCKGREPHTHK